MCPFGANKVCGKQGVHDTSNPFKQHDPAVHSPFRLNLSDFSWTRCGGSKPCVEMLLDAGARLDEPNHEGRSPLWAACANETWFGGKPEFLAKGFCFLNTIYWIFLGFFKGCSGFSRFRGCFLGLRCFSWVCFESLNFLLF